MHGGFLKSGYPQSSSILIRLFRSKHFEKPSSELGVPLHFKNIPSSHGNHHNWLVVFRPTPLKNHGVKVSWDDFPFPTEWKNVPNHQPATICPLKPMGVQPCATTRSFPHLHQLIGFEGSRRKDTPVPTTALCQEPRTSSVVQMVMIFNGDLINHYRMGPPR